MTSRTFLGLAEIALFVTLSSFTVPSHAFVIKLACDSQDHVISKSVVGNPVSLAVQLRISTDLARLRKLNPHERCERNQLSALPTTEMASTSESLLLVSEYNSRIRNRSSNQFPKAVAKRFITDAVASGVDPYLVLALALAESGPSTAKNRDAMRTLFVHKRAIQDTLNCKPVETMDAAGLDRLGYPQDILKIAKSYYSDSKAWVTSSEMPSELSEYRTSHPYAFQNLSCLARLPAVANNISACKITSQKIEDRPEIDLTTIATQQSETAIVNVCLSGESFSLSSNTSNDGCCLSAKALKSMLPRSDGLAPHGYRLQQSSELIRNVHRAVLMRVIQQKIVGQKSAPRETAADIAHRIQAWNGYGKIDFGKGECLDNIDYNRQPIYGATTADSMLNLLTINPEVSQLVKEAEEETGAKQKSIFCQGAVGGTTTVDSAQYVNLERQYLAGRNNCNVQQGQAITYSKWDISQVTKIFGNLEAAPN